jgi:hypothetical protein
MSPPKPRKQTSGRSLVRPRQTVSRRQFVVASAAAMAVPALLDDHSGAAQAPPKDAEFRLRPGGSAAGLWGESNAISTLGRASRRIKTPISQSVQTLPKWFRKMKFYHKQRNSL